MGGADEQSDEVLEDLDLADEESDEVRGGRKAGEMPMDYLTVNLPAPPPPPPKT